MPRIEPAPALLFNSVLVSTQAPRKALGASPYCTLISPNHSELLSTACILRSFQSLKITQLWFSNLLDYIKPKSRRITIANGVITSAGKMFAVRIGRNSSSVPIAKPIRSTPPTTESSASITGSKKPSI